MDLSLLSDQQHLRVEMTNFLDFTATHVASCSTVSLTVAHHVQASICHCWDNLWN